MNNPADQMFNQIIDSMFDELKKNLEIHYQTTRAYRHTSYTYTLHMIITRLSFIICEHICRKNIYQSRAAELLGINRNTLRKIVGSAKHGEHY